MSKHKTSARSRNTQKRKPAPSNPRLREVRAIAAVLATLPALDRSTENAELHPYNGIASSEAMQALVEKLVRQRYPENTWSAVHGPMCRAEGTGRGYWAWTDAFRDVSFQCGVEYAVRSLPDWWPLLRLISADTLKDLGVMVRSIAENTLDGELTDKQRSALFFLKYDDGKEAAGRG